MRAGCVGPVRLARQAASRARAVAAVVLGRVVVGGKCKAPAVEPGPCTCEFPWSEV
jgi:hypothetical protein